MSEQSLTPLLDKFCSVFIRNPLPGCHLDWYNSNFSDLPSYIDENTMIKDMTDNIRSTIIEIVNGKGDNVLDELVITHFVAYYTIANDICGFFDILYERIAEFLEPVIIPDDVVEETIINMSPKNN